MNEPERSELERLKQRQARLADELSLLARQLQALEHRLIQPEVKERRSDASRQETAVATPGPAIKPFSIPMPPPPIPPVIRPASVAAQTGGQPVPDAPLVAPPSPPPRAPLRVDLGDKAFLKGTCKSCGGHVEFPARAVGDTIQCPHCGQATVLASTPAPVPVPPPIPAAAAPAREPSFEMRLGTYWLVRIGIVMLLTGLVFFGNLAYQNYISQLGPAGKLVLLYLASFALLGAGAWWQRRAAKESLKNYAQVLFAGGLAAVYFTTYAAHHLENLRVIESAGWDGTLLLAWAGFMVWVADRKKSEVLAVFAVLLAYYTAIISHEVGLFTLYSNLVLTVAAVFFLVRNRWAAISFASLVATYAAYAFWRFLHGSQWRWAMPEEGLWTGTYFLIGYWVVFSAAVFLSKGEKLAHENRAGFLTFNNGAFFTMFLLTMWQVHQGGFWKFALIYGAVLLALAELSRRVLAAEPLAASSYLTQGLLLVTVGFIAKFSGMQLALVLAAESVVLLMLSQQRKSLILKTGAYLAAALAVAWGMDGMKEFDRAGLWLGMGLGALMVWNTLMVHRVAATPTGAALRPQPSYFAVLALLIWLVTTYNNTTRGNFPVVLAAEGLLLTSSIYLLRVRELVLLCQGYLVLAQLAWLFHFALQGRPLPPWWNPALLILISLGLGHWWQRQRILELRSQAGYVWQGVYALAIVGLLYFWLGPKFEAPAWLALTSLLAVGLTLYGVFTRAWLVSAFGQLFLLVSGAQFAWQLWEAKPAWHFPLAPIAALGLLSFGTVRWFQRKPDASGRIGPPLLQLALLYRWVALIMSIWWVCKYIPERERIWLLSLLGLWVFVWAGWQRNQEALLLSGAYTLSALALFWLPLIQSSTVYWPNLLVILVLLAQRQMARRLPERYKVDEGVHGAVIVVGGLSLWLFVSRWVLEKASGFYLTASWSALALVLFTCGIVLRERIYRWLGLGILACALVRVGFIDIWRLPELYRILSLVALGIVLLVLGFIYSKYQEKIREWL
jgi:uncharacterized membrane protein